jgi:hypothetical protein
VLLSQIVEPLVVRDNALQGPIASICIRLAAMKTGDRPRRDTGVIDDWGDNDSPCLLALREGAKLGDDQPLDLVFGLWDFFHNYACAGACTPAGFTIITEGIAGQTWAWRRLFHSPR